MVRLAENMIYPLLSEPPLPDHCHLSPRTAFQFCFLGEIIVWVYFSDYAQESVSSSTKQTNKWKSEKLALPSN